jgi:hypothetical protein
MEKKKMAYHRKKKRRVEKFVNVTCTHTKKVHLRRLTLFFRSARKFDRFSLFM